MSLRPLFLLAAALLCALVSPPGAAGGDVHGHVFGLATGYGGLGGNAFNDLIHTGFVLFDHQDETDCLVETPKGPGDERQTLQRLLDKGCNTIVAAGSYYAPAVDVLARKYPHAYFILINGQALSYPRNVAAGSNAGVFDAACQTENFAIGVDQDQDAMAPGYVLTSVVKRLDLAVYQMLRDVMAGRFENDVHVMDLGSGAVGLTSMRFTRVLVPDQTLQMIQRLKTAIDEGKIHVPTTEPVFRFSRIPD
jgi:basic membrane lipoprotein Med (substrate-binding protein (PBP1-ABC) superfamily)